MKRRIIVGALGAVLLAAAFYFYAGSGVPAGQSPLQDITAQNVAGFKNDFDAAKEDVRVLLLLSPT